MRIVFGLIAFCFCGMGYGQELGIPGYPMPMPVQMPVQQQVLQSPAMPPLVPPVSEAWVNGWQEVYIHRYEPLKNNYNNCPPAQYYVPTQQPCIQQPNPYYPPCQQYYYVRPCQQQHRSCWGW